MRVNTLERSVERLVEAQFAQSESLKALSDSVRTLVITLDRGKYFAIGIVIAVAALLGYADKIESILKILQ